MAAAVNQTPGNKKWYNTPSIRRCKDGTLHEGECQLITWSYTPASGSKLDEATGFGAVILEEADDFKKHFETDLKGDEKKLYDEWPRGFRWTCCGTPGDQKFGCDHHGWGSMPCTCDFCRMGKPIPDKIYDERMKSAHGMGLDLPRGPDPRSKQKHTAIDELMRAILGMDE